MVLVVSFLVFVVCVLCLVVLCGATEEPNAQRETKRTKVVHDASKVQVAPPAAWRIPFLENVYWFLSTPIRECSNCSEARSLGGTKRRDPIPSRQQRRRPREHDHPDRPQVPVPEATSENAQRLHRASRLRSQSSVSRHRQNAPRDHRRNNISRVQTPPICRDRLLRSIVRSTGERIWGTSHGSFKGLRQGYRHGDALTHLRRLLCLRIFFVARKHQRKHTREDSGDGVYQGL